jgi:hypothetical protein
MKKILLFGILMINFAGLCQSGAKIEFKNDVVDYGTVSKANDDGIRAFEFTNTGDSPLIINAVNSTCGCTVATKPDQAIMPGKMGKIIIQYNMMTGTIRKTITVESNAVNVEDGVSKLSLKGEVIGK